MKVHTMKTSTKILLTCLLGSVFLGHVSAQSPTASPEAVQQRVSAKVELVKETVHKWAESGRDPSTILKTMQGKVGPLIEAGKLVEADAELDHVLEALNHDEKSAESLAASSEAARQRVVAKIERVKEGAHQWESAGRSTAAIAKMMEEKVKPLLDGGKFSEGDLELDRVLEALKQDGKGAESPTTPSEAAHQRVVAKIDRVKEVMEKLAEGGNDPSAIGRMMEEKVKPLLEKGKFVEADAELDRVLEEIQPDGKSSGSTKGAQ